MHTRLIILALATVLGLYGGYTLYLAYRKQHVDWRIHSWLFSHGGTSNHAAAVFGAGCGSRTTALAFSLGGRGIENG